MLTFEHQNIDANGSFCIMILKHGFLSYLNEMYLLGKVRCIYLLILHIYLYPDVRKVSESYCHGSICILVFEKYVYPSVRAVSVS